MQKLETARLEVCRNLADLETIRQGQDWSGWRDDGTETGQNGPFSFDHLHNSAPCLTLPQPPPPRTSPRR